MHTYEILTAAKDHLLCFVTLPAYYRKLVPSFILFTNKVYRYNTPNSSRFYLPFPYIIRKFFVTYQDPVSLQLLNPGFRNAHSSFSSKLCRDTRAVARLAFKRRATAVPNSIHSEALASASGTPWVSKSTHPRKFGNDVTVHRAPPTVRPHHRNTNVK